LVAEFVRLEVEGGIGTIRLDRPPVNALNRQLQTELVAAVDAAQADPEVYSVIVYGGPKSFAGGADIKEMAALSHAEMTDRVAELSGALGHVSSLTKPTVAAITGYALGGGMEIALSCDRRIIGDNVRLGQPEILLGIIPGGGGTQRLARLVGPARAKDIIFTGRNINAEEALAIGLADEVVAPDAVYEAARSWAGQFTGGPGRALAAAKAAIDGGLEVDLASGLKLEQHLFAALFATADRTIGMTSFIESGPGKATFTGK
jgi:enoyl-CoA hydratase/carnithine racemase